MPEINTIDASRILSHAIKSGGLKNLTPVLPFMFELRGEPFSLKDHLMWEPLFSTEIPKKRTVKSSRQVGKCLPADTLILRGNGCPAPIQSIEIGDRVACLDDGALTSVTGVVTNKWVSGVKPVIKLVTRSRRSITSTKEHQIRCLHGYECAGDLRVGDAIAVCADDTVVWDPIVTIEELAPVETIDIEVASTGNFLLHNGIVAHNSESTAIQLLTYTQMLNYVNLLYVAPRYEQTRVFSVDKVAQYIRHSPIFANRDSSLPMNITHRVAKDGNNLYFAYAMADADRIRSKTAGGVFIDEVQDVDPLIFPVLLETLSASKDLGFVQHTGTPKTFDNALEIEWSRSSQAEWCVPCVGCKKLNVPSAEFDLLGMIQKKGLSCVKCGALLNTRLGWWEHRYAPRRSVHDGYHLPQIVFPVHCEHQPREDRSKAGRKWVDILMAMEEWPTGKFYNEKLGESFDNADELISKKALIENSVLKHKNELNAALTAARDRRKYAMVTMGVDWGGGGESGLSRTAVAIVGWKSDGKPDVLYMDRLVNPLPLDEEVNYLRRIAQQFGVDLMADDFCGAGSSKEIVLLQSGFPQSKLMPVAYIATSSRKMMEFIPGDETTAMPHIRTPKAKSLSIMAALMNKGYYKFPVFESWDAKGYPEQLLALVQEKRDRSGGPASYVVTHKANRADDLAHAINYATLSYWFVSKNMPDLTKMFPET